MGGPMNYARFVSRNALTGWGYQSEREDPPLTDPRTYPKGYLEGELRRMESDQMAAAADYAKQGGIGPEQALRVLRAFLGVPEPDCANCLRLHQRAHGALVNLGRCQAHVVYGVPVPRRGDFQP